MIENALRNFRAGKPVLIYDFDDREGETDIAIPAISVTPRDVTTMRIDGGGLICVAIHPKAAERLKLPFMHDIIRVASERLPELKSFANFDIKYDSRSSFSIWVNHRDTFTGITDRDRALTIRRLGEIVDYVMLRDSYFDLGLEFRCPGHVAVLRASDNLVYERVGQTELSVALAEMAGISPAVAICEMLDAETGRSLSKSKARRYAEERDLPFVEGKDVVKAYKRFKEEGSMIFE